MQIGTKGCQKCGGFVTRQHGETYCLNCSARHYQGPSSDFCSEYCIYCRKRQPDLERSNLSCRICLDKVNAIRQQQRMRNANYGRTLEEVRTRTA